MPRARRHAQADGPMAWRCWAVPVSASDRASESCSNSEPTGENLKSPQGRPSSGSLTNTTTRPGTGFTAIPNRSEKIHAKHEQIADWLSRGRPVTGHRQQRNVYSCPIHRKTRTEPLRPHRASPQTRPHLGRPGIERQRSPQGVLGHGGRTSHTVWSTKARRTGTAVELMNKPALPARPHPPVQKLPRLRSAHRCLAGASARQLRVPALVRPQGPPTRRHHARRARIRQVTNSQARPARPATPAAQHARTGIHPIACHLPPERKSGDKGRVPAGIQHARPDRRHGGGGPSCSSSLSMHGTPPPPPGRPPFRGAPTEGSLNCTPRAAPRLPPNPAAEGQAAAVHPDGTRISSWARSKRTNPTLGRPTQPGASSSTGTTGHGLACHPADAGTPLPRGGARPGGRQATHKVRPTQGLAQGSSSRNTQARPPSDPQSHQARPGQQLQSTQHGAGRHCAQTTSAAARRTGLGLQPRQGDRVSPPDPTPEFAAVRTPPSTGLQRGRRAPKTLTRRAQSARNQPMPTANGHH